QAGAAQPNGRPRGILKINGFPRTLQPRTASENRLPSCQDVVQRLAEVRRRFGRLLADLRDVLVPALHDLVAELAPQRAGRERLLAPLRMIRDDVADERPCDALRARIRIARPEHRALWGGPRRGACTCGGTLLAGEPLRRSAPVRGTGALGRRVLLARGRPAGSPCTGGCGCGRLTAVPSRGTRGGCPRDLEGPAAARAARADATRRDPRRINAEEGLAVWTADVHESVVASSSSLSSPGRPNWPGVSESERRSTA